MIVGLGVRFNMHKKNKYLTPSKSRYDLLAGEIYDRELST